MTPLWRAILFFLPLVVVFGTPALALWVGGEFTSPDTVVAPSSEAGRLVWQHLLGTVSAPLAHADRWRTPVAVPAGLIAEGRRALSDAGWDGDTPLVVVHAGAGSGRGSRTGVTRGRSGQ